MPAKRIGRNIGVDPQTWANFARRNKTFSSQLDKAKANGREKWRDSLMGAIGEQIAKGHPWWTKLAIHNGLVPGFCDPDVIAQIKIKRSLEKPQGDGDAGFIEANPALAGTSLPRGAVPSMEQPGSIQGGSSGTAIRKDGSSETQAGP